MVRSSNLYRGGTSKLQSGKGKKVISQNNINYSGRAGVIQGHVVTRIINQYNCKCNFHVNAFLLPLCSANALFVLYMPLHQRLCRLCSIKALIGDLWDKYVNYTILEIINY